jgi:hypothetical protein
MRSLKPVKPFHNLHDNDGSEYDELLREEKL